MSNRFVTVLYVGVTNDLLRRVYEHKQGLWPCFTHKYHLDQLMFFDETDDVSAALYREKQIKNWRREWKMNLIRELNPSFEDLAKDWYDFYTDRHKPGSLGDAETPARIALRCKAGGSSA